MPNWVPVSVPTLCPTCGAYWECGCGVVSQEQAKAQFIPEVMTPNIQALIEKIDNKFGHLKEPPFDAP